MNKINKFNDFLLEKEFNQILNELYLIVESKGKWVDDRTYEWEFNDTEEEETRDWLDKAIDKVEDFVSKLPKEKIKSYFIRLMNSLKNMPDGIRKRLIRGYVSVFLVVASIGYLTNGGNEPEKLDQQIKQEIVQVADETETSQKSDFKMAQSIVKSVEAGYSDDRSDSGNWIEIPGAGQRFVGTNHGISAQTLKEYLGRYPKKEDMMNLKYSDALKIYKKNYWDAQNLSEFKNQSVANIIYDACVNQGVPGTAEILRQALSENGLDVDNPYSTSSIKLINKLDQKKLFDSIKKFREIRYRNARTWDVHGEGWMNRLAEFRFKKNNIVA